MANFFQWHGFLGHNIRLKRFFLMGDIANTRRRHTCYVKAITAELPKVAMHPENCTREATVSKTTAKGNLMKTNLFRK